MWDEHLKNAFNMINCEFKKMCYVKYDEKKEKKRLKNNCYVSKLVQKNFLLY
jgi:hypothetical protein